MKSGADKILPLTVKRQLKKLGQDIAIARKKRKFTQTMMAERMNVSFATYNRLERGDPSVTMGVYAMAFYVLGVPGALGNLVDASEDERGLMLEIADLPKRVRLKKQS